jgi:hypothetical protein
MTGDQQRDFAKLHHRPTPADRVLSVVYKEVLSGYGPMKESLQEVWRADDESAITSLLEQFGPAPKEL